MALKDIIAEVAAILATVPDIGRVHAYRRAVAAQTDIEAVFKDVVTGQIRGWEVSREATASQDMLVAGTRERHQIVVYGYMSINDAKRSEETFQELVEAVRDAFRVKRNLNGKAFDTTPMSARTVTAAMKAGVLVHYCELTMEAQQFPVTTA